MLLYFTCPKHFNEVVNDEAESGHQYTQHQNEQPVHNVGHDIAVDPSEHLYKKKTNSTHVCNLLNSKIAEVLGNFSVKNFSYSTII